MLLALDDLSYRLEEEQVHPFWLGENDDAWVEEALEAMAEGAGHSLDVAEEIVRPRVVRIARERSVPARVALSLWALERSRWELRVDAPVTPSALREVAFELAAKHGAEQAVALSAARFRIHPEEVVAALFADRRGRRVLVAPETRTTAREAVVRYDLAVAQTLVARSMELEAYVRDDALGVITHAKRLGLVASFRKVVDALQLSVSGPLALFHETTKYGRALARLVPVLAGTPAWSLRAHVMLGDRSGWLSLDETGPLGRVHALPADADSGVARRIARALRLGGHDWRVESAELVEIDGAIAVPDFALVSARGRVLVDVVPFATPEYLARKLDVVRRLPGRMIVCVDERFAPASPGALVLRYRGVVDVTELVAAAERITSISGGAPSSAPACPSRRGASSPASGAAPP